MRYRCMWVSGRATRESRAALQMKGVAYARGIAILPTGKYRKCDSTVMLVHYYGENVAIVVVCCVNVLGLEEKSWVASHERRGGSGKHFRCSPPRFWRHQSDHSCHMTKPRICNNEVLFECALKIVLWRYSVRVILHTKQSTISHASVHAC